MFNTAIKMIVHCKVNYGVFNSWVWRLLSLGVFETVWNGRSSQSDSNRRLCVWDQHPPPDDPRNKTAGRHGKLFLLPHTNRVHRSLAQSRNDPWSTWGNLSQPYPFFFLPSPKSYFLSCSCFFGMYVIPGLALGPNNNVYVCYTLMHKVSCPLSLLTLRMLLQTLVSLKGTR